MREIEFAKARKVMKETLLKDKDLYYGYHANIAMLLYDEQLQNEGEPIDFIDPDNRNGLAKEILNLIFSLDVKNEL